MTRMTRRRRAPERPGVNGRCRTRRTVLHWRDAQHACPGASRHRGLELRYHSLSARLWPAARFAVLRRYDATSLQTLPWACCLGCSRGKTGQQGRTLDVPCAQFSPPLHQLTPRQGSTPAHQCARCTVCAFTRSQGATRRPTLTGRRRLHPA